MIHCHSCQAPLAKSDLDHFGVCRYCGYPAFRDPSDFVLFVQGPQGGDSPQGSSTPPTCQCCDDLTDDLEEVAPTTGRPGGRLCGNCREMLNEPECTCYEASFGHQPGCAFYGRDHV
jgi:hypothetical protein